MESELLVYTNKITSRNKYIFNFIFKEILGVKILITSDKNAFQIKQGAKINYSLHPIEDELFFASRNILFETGMFDQQLTVFEHKEIPCFFTVGKKSVLPFDPFAASFYLVSRYEEYLPHIKDQYFRYTPEQSIAYENGFLDLPVVDHWALMIKDIISQRFPEFLFPVRKFKYIPTIDVDNAFAFKNKGLMRTLGGIAKSITIFDAKSIIKRLQVVFNLAKDPFDTFTKMEEIHKQYKLQAIYFYLFASYATNDKNIHIDNKTFQSLIKSTADYFDVGIHPSFASNSNRSILKKEIKNLSSVLNIEVNKSRQHFLMLTLPDTYRNLINIDIKDDYTMGYSSCLGFRAGTCTPFYFYDIDMEVQTNLKVHPFQIMDATLKYYNKTDEDDVLSSVSPIIDAVKAVNGTLVTLWHNESISGISPWVNWENIYDDIIKYIMAE
ncbi:MAG: polysaccharide deacetylase family protein [Bacteroidota bacterium]